MEDGKKKANYALVSSMLMMLFLGIIYLWSIFKDPVVEYYGWTQEGSSAVFSIMFPLNIFGVIAGGFLIDRKGMRFTLLLGFWLTFLGLVLTSFVPGEYPWLIYITYAAMVGFGAGLFSNCCLSCVQKWWYDRKGLAVGLVNCSYAISSVVFAPLINMLLKTRLSVPGTFRVLGAGFLIIFLLTFRSISFPPEGWIKATEQDGTQYTSAQKQYKPGEVLRSARYYLFMLCNICVMSGYLMLNSMFKSFAISKGLSEALAVTCVMLSGIGSAAGRLFVSWLTDRIASIKVMMGVFVVLFLSLGATFLSGSAVFIIAISGVSLCFGASASLSSVLNVENFGTKYLSSNYSIISFGAFVAGLVSPNLGIALSSGGVPTAEAIIVAMVLAAVGFFAAMVLGRLMRKQLKQAS
ncbi:MAG: MFS transporter [Oscillospiraceae bacterium]|jgi:OFA family oxalate/formate antiporter-like MFS transporter